MTTAAQPSADKPVREPIALPPTSGNIDPSQFTFMRGDFAYVDTETTGVDAEIDRICEIAIVRYRNGVREIFHTLVDPEIPIPPTASAVHHITDETIAEAKARGEAPTFAEIADKVIEMLDGAHVYAHNAPFDESFVDGELGVELDPKSWVCTVRLSRHLFPDAPAHGNQVLHYWLKTKPESAGLGPHRAIDDVFTSLENTFHMWNAAAMLQVKSHEGLLELANRTIWVDTMHFGTHVGKAFKDIPSSYFEWALGRVPGKEGLTDIDDDLRQSMERELSREGRKEDDARIKAEADSKVVPATTMDFGNKHNGKLMTVVPMDYLEWIERDNPRCSPEVRAGVRVELERRRALERQQRAGGAVAASSGAESPAAAVFHRLRGLVSKGSEEEGRLLATERADNPEAALVDYLTGFAKAAPAEFTRVASLTQHAQWMHQVTGVAPARAAAPAPAAARAALAPSPAAPAAEVAGTGGRLNLFAKRQAEPEDDGVPPDFDEGGGAPFEEAPAPRRMRMR
jgi:exodeoxyribonuclease X